MLLIFISFTLSCSTDLHNKIKTGMMGPWPRSLRASYNYLDSMPLCTTSSTIMVVIISDGYCYWRLILQLCGQSPLQELCGLHAPCSTSHPYPCAPLQRMGTAILGTSCVTGSASLYTLATGRWECACSVCVNVYVSRPLIVLLSPLFPSSPRLIFKVHCCRYIYGTLSLTVQVCGRLLQQFINSWAFPHCWDS